ncbi:putative Replication factor C subunit 5 [Paratrimastix pyriformis]|uniref:Replication factor C subunit 5 n=1 Tax=Paratrimastix pyriformis TaxID=342808 RepID=A0ABQ8ULH6_9EUKA|nr:putative Replication factor C subunit 5 [Paratrimastix pyriformis]
MQIEKPEPAPVVQPVPADQAPAPQPPKSTPKTVPPPPASGSSTLPFVEKYRPKELSDLISHEDIIGTITKLIDQNRLPHLLLYGPPGTGKTSTILACAKKLYGDKFGPMVLELNASDERGIDVVREQVKTFATTRALGVKGFKLVILDEADAMTHPAQFALRRVIEKCSHNARFCLICNYVGKIIPALQSRCTKFRFGPLDHKAVEGRMHQIAQAEHIAITPEAISTIVSLAEGDMRKCLNVLQSTALQSGERGEVTADMVYQTTGKPHPEDITRLLEWMLNEDFTRAFHLCWELKTAKGLALQDVATEIHARLLHVDLAPMVKCDVLDQLSTIAYNASYGLSEKIQFAGILAVMQRARHSVLQMAAQAQGQQTQ